MQAKNRTNENIIKFFHKVYKTSKAYKNFVDSSNIKSETVKTISDFKKIPIMDKLNYIKKYPLKDKLYNGKTPADYYMVCTSSGTSGKPTFWLRDYNTDLGLEIIKENLYKKHFNIDKKKTLCVVTFGLGPWTAGMLTSKSSWAAAKNNKFTVVTPGINKENAYEFLSKLYKFYDQTLILGYPPFIADLIEYAQENQFDLKKANIKVMCTAERFSENWRNSLVSAISSSLDRHDVVGFYASSDTGILGVESKFSINLLYTASKKPKLAEALFKINDVPTLVEYNPSTRFLECINGEILITIQQPIPLIRYNIHDRGGLITGKKIETICKQFGIKVKENLKDKNYVFVWGRSDSVTITANIYIEDIKYCLENSKFKDRFTGNFKYGREKAKELRYRLKVIVYLKKGEKRLNKKETEYFEKEFYENLLKANNDFRMIQSGTKIEKFNIRFEQDNITNKYATSKLKYFL